MRRMDKSLSRASVIATILLTLAFVLQTQASASSSSRDECEKQEVRAIFSMLLAELTGGDGWPIDIPCVIPEQWPDFTNNNDGKIIRVRALLTPREAMDPKGEHPEKFCDFKTRNTEAREKAKKLDGDDHAHITTGDLSLTYPIFNSRLTRAKIQREGRNDSWYKNGKGDFVASWGLIYLIKKKGAWTARFETHGIAN